MATTDLQRFLFRSGVGDKGGRKPTFFDSEIDMFFAAALTVYPDGSDETLLCYAVIQGLETLAARAASQVTYKQNESSENLSDIAKAYEARISGWRVRLNKSLPDPTKASARWSPMKVSPNRRKDVPRA